MIGILHDLHERDTAVFAKVLVYENSSVRFRKLATSKQPAGIRLPLEAQPSVLAASADPLGRRFTLHCGCSENPAQLNPQSRNLTLPALTASD